jgi:ketosteroid isomerase-like protein
MKTQLNRIRIIRIFTLLLAISFIINACYEKQELVSNEEIEQTILDLERQALDHWSNGDPIGFSKNFAVDATYFDDIGAEMRIDSIEALTTYFTSLDGNIPVHKYELVTPKVQVYGDIAILTLQYHAMSLENEPGPPWKATSVYRLIDDKWQVVHANWSLVEK